MFLTIKTKSHMLPNSVKILSRHGRKLELCVSREQKFSTEDLSIAAKSYDFGSAYTAQEKNIILETINISTVDELKRYRLTEARIKKVIAYRDKHEGYKTLDEVLLLHGIDIGVLDKFCKSIVKKDSPSTQRGTTARGTFLTPPLDDHIRTTIDTCTGIWVCGDLISWAQLDRSSNLLQWDCQSLEDVNIKDGLVAIVDSVARVVSKVPISDAYVMESDPIIPLSRMTTAAYYVHLQRQQINATIATVLGTREPCVDVADSDETLTLINNVYMIRSRTPARLFDLLIGSEMVSAQTVVEGMFEGDENEKNVSIFVNANSKIQECHKSHDIYQREQMNWALLLVAAFVNLSITRTASLKKTTFKRAGRKLEKQTVSSKE